MSPVFGHGRLRLYLLKLLDESPRHGYEVIRLLQDRFLGVYSPSPGTIYPRLARLEEEGLVTHEVVDGKKVFSITDKGREPRVIHVGLQTRTQAEVVDGLAAGEKVAANRPAAAANRPANQSNNSQRTANQPRFNRGPQL